MKNEIPCGITDLVGAFSGNKNCRACPMIDKDINGGDFNIVHDVNTWNACGNNPQYFLQ